MGYPRFSAVGSVCITAFGLTFAQWAQAAEATAPSASKAGIEEVIVTAERTSESIQDVPIAVTAFTGEMMEAKQIINPTDLQLNVPNVTFTATNFGGSNFSIRGIGNLVIGGQSGVSIHLDEIAMPTNLVAAEFVDMERVEVLRGPQGTLFGRNATGGAINLVTNKPNMDGVSGNVDVEYGDYDNQRVKGAVNLPITENLGLRFAGMDLQRDGYIDNTAAGQVGSAGRGLGTTISGIDDNVDGRDLSMWRLTGLWNISDNMTAWVQYNEFNEDDDRVRITNQVCKRTPQPVLGCEPNASGFDQPNFGSTTGGVFSGLIGASNLGDPTGVRSFPTTSSDFREMHTDFEPRYLYSENNWTGNLAYEFDKFTVSLSGGYQDSKFFSQQDYLMDVGPDLNVTAFNPSGLYPTSDTAGRYGAGWESPTCNFNNGTAGIFGGCVHPSNQTRVFAFDQSDGKGEYWTGELKAQSSFDGPLNFLVGVNMSNGQTSAGNYYVNANTLDIVGNYGVPKLGFPQLYPTMFDNTGNPNRSGENESQSVFGEVYFQATDTIKLTVGLRYNDDELETSSTSVLFNSLNTCTIGLAALIPDCAGSPANFAWLRSTLAPLLGFNPAAPGYAAGQQLAEYYGVYDDYLAAFGAGNIPGAINVLYDGVPPVPGFNETRALTGSPSETDFQETTGRAGVDWQLSENSMVYGFFTRGYKPGGFNPAIPPAFQSTSAFTFEPEKVDAFEIGSKNVLFDNSLMLNASVFTYDYQGLQVSRIANNSSINDNIDAKIWGVEIETVWRPEFMPNLSVDANYAHLVAEADGATSIDPMNRAASDASFVNLKNIDPGSNTGLVFVAKRSEITPAHIAQAYAACRALGANNPLNGTTCPGVVPGTDYPDGLPAYFSKLYLQGAPGAGNTIGAVQTSDGREIDIDGNTLPGSPENTFGIGVSYDFALSFGTITPRVDYHWQDDMYGREFNTVGDEIEAWDQVNASVMFLSSGGRWQGMVFGRNLQDEDNVTGHYLTSDTSGFYRNYFLTEPRIWGASVRYNFGEL
jgi:outer membrane receptor protein involved in Fe transport